MKRGFFTIMSAQFLSSLADNALFVAAVQLLRSSQAPEWQQAALVPMFALFYVVLAPFVGAFADSMPKGRVMLLSNFVKIAGCLLMLFGTHPLMAYAIVGLGAAAYSPAKYGILTELLPPSQLVKGNGWIEGLTVGSIVLGILLGGQLIGLAAVIMAFGSPILAGLLSGWDRRRLLVLALLWFAAVAMTALGALQWPIVQHYLASGRHGPEMRNAVGWWNATWMAATAMGLAIAGPLESMGLMRWAIPSLLLTNLGAIAFLTAFPKHPPHHDADAHAAHVPPTYRALLGAARVLHPMGYLVIGALSPILPYLFIALDTQPSAQAPIGATWHVARLLAVIVLWRTVFWHGRGATLVAAGLLLSLGFAFTITAPNEAVLIAGLAALGLGQGTIYYSAIYYGLAVGGAKIEAGGIHEALVGAGYFVGPGLGLLSLGAERSTPVFIGLVTGALAFGFVVALWQAGRARSQSTA